MSNLDATNSIPINQTAGRVIGKGIQYEPEIKGHSGTRDFPYKIRPLIQIPRAVRNQKGWIDLTGRKRGSLTVIGLLAAEVYDRWVVRCCCGCYELKKAKSLKIPITTACQTRCESCMDLWKIKRMEYIKIYGKSPPNDFLLE